MKKIIGRKMYDTETAKEICEWSNKTPNDMRYSKEILYKTPNGRYFLWGKGGPMTRWGVAVDGGTIEGSNLIALNENEVMDWLESIDHYDVYAEEFKAHISDA